MTAPRSARRTKAALEKAITTAISTELFEHGYDAVTFEGVARRARVSKPVLYRRYSSRASMVLSVVASNVATAYSVPPMTGTLRGDLIAWLTNADEQLTTAISRTLRGLIGEANADDLEQMANVLRLRLNDMDRCVLAPARERGEIQHEIPESVTRTFFIAIRDRALFGPRDSWKPTQLTDEVFLPLLRAQPHKPQEPDTTATTSKVVHS